MLIALALQAAASNDARNFAACRAAAVAPCSMQRGVIVIGNGGYPIRLGTASRRHPGGAICQPGRIGECESIPIDTPPFPQGAPPSGYALAGRFTYCPIRKQRPGHLTIGCLAGADKLRWTPLP